jgi:tetratricopeptide (TPR) repeat protein
MKMRLQLKGRLKAALLLSLLISACQGGARSLFERAESEAAHQRGQLARYFYLQAIEKNSFKDQLRFDSLKGLADLCFDQLFDYREGMKAAEMAIAEFGQSIFFQKSIDELRLKAAFVSRVHLQDPERSLDFIKPIIDGGRIPQDSWQEVGRIYLDLRDYGQAESAFRQFWNGAQSAGRCRELREAQLDLMQTFSLARTCNKTLEWGRATFPGDCKPDMFSVRVEMAHCYEIRGESEKAISLIQEILNENPENYRAEYLLKNIRKRQKEKASR